MATALLNITSNNATSDLHFILEYTYSQNIQNNTTTLTINAYLEYKGGVASVGSDSSTIKVDGKTIKSGSYRIYKKDGKTSIGSVSKTVSHNSDGSFPTTKISYSVSSYHWKPAVSSSVSISSSSINTIPRASSINSISNTTLGATNGCVIKWTPKNSTYKYKLNFTLGSTSITVPSDSYITPAQTTEYTYNYTLPIETFAPKITTSTKGTVTAYLYTYNSSGTQIGSVQSKTFQVTVPSNDNTRPTVTISRSINNDNSSIPSTWGTIAVQGYSKVTFTGSNASAKYNAAIVKYIISGDYNATINNSSLNHTTTAALSKSGSNKFTIKAVDSRGIESQEYSVSVSNVYPYSSPTIKVFTVKRNDTVTTQVDYDAQWSFSSLGNKNKITVTIKGYDNAKLYTLTNGTETSIKDNQTGVPENQSPSYIITISDSLGNSATRSIKVPTAKVLLDFKDGGEALGIGRVLSTASGNEDTGLVVAFPSKFEKNVNFSGATTVTFNTNCTPNLYIANPNDSTKVDSYSLKTLIRDFYYYPGESVKNLQYWGGGYITDGRKRITFSIPWSKNVEYVNTVNISSLTVSVRGFGYYSNISYGGYLIENIDVVQYASTYTITGTINNNLLYICINKPDEYQVKNGNNNYTPYNNVPVGVYASVTLTLGYTKPSTNSEDDFYEDETDPTNGDSTENNSGESTNTENNETNNLDSQSTTENAEEENP